MYFLFYPQWENTCRPQRRNNHHNIPTTPPNSNNGNRKNTIPAATTAHTTATASQPCQPVTDQYRTVPWVDEALPFLAAPAGSSSPSRRAVTVVAQYGQHGSSGSTGRPHFAQITRIPSSSRLPFNFIMAQLVPAGNSKQRSRAPSGRLRHVSNVSKCINTSGSNAQQAEEHQAHHCAHQGHGQSPQQQIAE